MIISQLSIIPVGVSTSVSRYVRLAIDVLKENNAKYEINDMATVIETKDMEEIFELVKKIHKTLIDASVKRLIIELKIDDRRDKNVKLGDKTRALKQ